MTIEQYFLNNYEDCRTAFVRSSEELAKHYKDVDISKIKVPSKTDNDLTIDLCYVPAQKESKRLLLLTSGVHGIEGFTGHAVQSFFIKELMPSSIDNNSTGVLIIHGINPYGFKYERRVSETNVDMNRNFDIDDSLFSINNVSYTKINDFLNPTKPFSSMDINNILFPVKAVFKIAQYGMSVLRQAIIQGQYRYKKGIFFGGSKFEPQKNSMEILLKECIAYYKNILVIDIHTGYGERNRLHLFGNSDVNDKARVGIERVFKGYKIDGAHNSKKFYTVSGSFTEYVSKLCEQEQTYIPMAFEFGTLNSHKTIGSITSLKNIIMENQSVNHGVKTKQDQKRIKRIFREMFYPSDLKWRNEIIRQVADIFPVIIQRFQEEY